MDLRVELAQLVDAARAHGLTSVDCHAIDNLLRRHAETRACECARPDLLAGDQLSRVSAP